MHFPWALLAVPAIVLAGRLIAGLARSGRAVAWMLSPALGFAAWLIALHVLGRFFGSFHSALFWATCGVSSLGAAWLCLMLGRSWRGQGAKSSEPKPHRHATIILTTLAATAFIAPTALGWSFHDELHYTGHFSIASQMLRDVYPPRHLTFPQFELRYHYGFNVLVAALAATCNLPVGAAIDAVTLTIWAYCWCMLWGIGTRVAGPRGGFPTALLALFGAGVPWLVTSGYESETFRLLGLVNVNGSTLNPPLVSYFFQHPWTAGLPLGLSLILVHVSEPESRDEWVLNGRLVVMGILLMALALCQYVLFVSLAAALCVAEPIVCGKPQPRSVALVVGTIGAVWLASTMLGGFFLPPPDRGESPLVISPWVAGKPWASLLWHAATYGLLLPLGIGGLFAARRGRVLLGCLIAGGIIIINALTYRYSWDIVKFGTVAALGLSIASGASVVWLFARKPRPLGLLLGVAAMAGATLAGLAFPLAFALRLEGIPRDMFPERPASLSLEDAAAVRWLRGRVKPDEIVYRRMEIAPAYAQFGGLPQAWFDQATMTFGFAKWRLSSRARLLATMPDDPVAFRAQRIRWFVVDPEDSRASELIDDWVRHGRATEVARFGALRIARLE